MRKLLPLAAVSASLSACVSTPPDYFPQQRPAPSANRPAPPPQQPPVRPAPSTPTFIAPQVMNLPGLEAVIGRNATALANIFGLPRLEVKEGDAVKLQFSGNACVLDIYLYPLRPGGEPSATHVEARRASDGEDVDRAACVRALRR
ncbi:hypothetical protein [Qipengyuania vesicularis]|uniref:hypothetical protein n=1 Tax=Qipengyuania vesicularis TaxID=2867232 RepID=UPI001C88A4DB|nr:hypothetical protein [Qipengyuania vesicularis]MBX7528189.1 hypothetical protein [Qipengyuania vesicularis]